MNRPLITDSTLMPEGDCSGSFGGLRSHLVNGRGERLVDFLKTLEPSYARVYFDIALGYGVLIATMVVACLAQARSYPWPIVTLLGAVSVGFWSNYLIAFIHEGTHWNLASRRRTNDIIADVGLSWLNGMEIGFYRRVHFEHHRSLGLTNDSEYSYFFPLNSKFLFKGLFGIRAAETILSYRAKTDGTAPAAATKPRANMRAFYIEFVCALAAHAAIVAGLWWNGYSAASAAWVFGIGGVMPMLASMRQILEHRADDADRSANFFLTDHGAVTRHFGDGAFANAFGSAGFNRHLLHHWEPQVSYTRLADLERFLIDTPMGPILDRRRSTYSETFRRLFSLY
jgi:fatty acid desaturase